MKRSFLKRASSFSISYVQWLMMGKPLRSPEVMKELFVICEPCDFYDPKLFNGVGGCRSCGCLVSPDSEIEVNKLAWPHESCPEEKWFAEVRSHDG